MYSYEDRIRAVQLYIQLGKRIGVTIRQLGYSTPGPPSRSTFLTSPAAKPPMPMNYTASYGAIYR